MKQATFIIALLFLISSFSCSKQEVAVPAIICGSDYSSHPDHQLYQQYLQDFQDASRAPGCIMLINKEGRPLWIGSTGVSHLESNTAMCTATPFRLGSITKVFIATLVIRLSEEGKFSLDDKLNKLLPNIASHIPSSEKISVRQLLGHISGITDPPNLDTKYQTAIIDNAEGFARKTTIQLLEEYVYDKKLLFEPGSQYAYSNAGYWILGLIAEKVTGQPLAICLQEKVIKPVNLRETYIERLEKKEVARGYALTTSAKVKDVTQFDIAEADGKAAGGIISTAKDISAFYEALFNGKIISPDALEEMKTIQLPGCAGTDCEYGLGLEVWHIDGHTGFGHNGSLLGVEANALYFPDSKTIIILYKNLGGGSDKSFLKNVIP